MSRVQLAWNVANLEASIAFFSQLLNAEPAKIRSGYPNFADAEPLLKLVLLEQSTATGTWTAGPLSHLGVDVGDSEAVTPTTARLTGEGLATQIEGSTTGCCAVQGKVWVEDPDGTPWEVYRVLADSLTSTRLNVDAICCSTSHSVNLEAHASAALGSC